MPTVPKRTKAYQISLSFTTLPPVLLPPSARHRSPPGFLSHWPRWAACRLNSAPLARYIPDTTKSRIQRAAKKLGYRPNLFARTLRNQRTHTVGVMVFDMTDPFCMPILRGIETALYQASFLPILTDVHNDRSRFERYLEMLLDRRVEALIVRASTSALTP